MIVLFTDYGLAGPYVGQLHAVLQREAPGVPVIDLMHDAPAFAPRQAAYLLAALVEEFPVGTVFSAWSTPASAVHAGAPSWRWTGAGSWDPTMACSTWWRSVARPCAGGI
jgi:S-adenosyl-L-methionine hydrolase (adenosine-forming)